MAGAQRISLVLLTTYENVDDQAITDLTDSLGEFVRTLEALDFPITDWHFERHAVDDPAPYAEEAAIAVQHALWALTEPERVRMVGATGPSLRSYVLTQLETALTLLIQHTGIVFGGTEHSTKTMDREGLRNSATEEEIELVDALERAEIRGSALDPEDTILAENAILAYLDIPLDHTEQGITPQANQVIERFIAEVTEHRPDNPNRPSHRV